MANKNRIVAAMADLNNVRSRKCSNHVHRYRCLSCGDVFMPILEEGLCSKCDSTRKEKLTI